MSEGLGNRAVELAELRAEQERDAGVMQASTALQGMGRPFCKDCGHSIPEDRRKAMPSADRCFPCQEIEETTP